MSLSKDQGVREVQEYLVKNTDKDQYNPYQDEGERRHLRKLYRDLTEKTLEMRRELIASDVKESNYKVIDKSNVLYDLVRNPQEAVLDSRLLVLQADMNTQKAKNLKIGTDMLINLDEFVSKIISSSREGVDHGEDDEYLDWEYLGKNAIHFGKRAVSMDFMLGPLAVEQKQVKRNKTSRLTKNKEDLVIPAQLKEGDLKQQENETSKNVNDIYKILSEVEPINYFRFVTNPESFSQTVENIFYVSFLARKAVVGINMETGQPVLSTRSPPNVENLNDIVNKKQIVMGIDMKDWKEIIDTYKITTSYIPTRETNQALGSSTSKWY